MQDAVMSHWPPRLRLCARVLFWVAVVMALITFASAVQTSVSIGRNNGKMPSLSSDGYARVFLVWNLRHLYVIAWMSLIAWVLAIRYFSARSRGREARAVGWIFAALGAICSSYLLVWGIGMLHSPRDASGWITIVTTAAVESVDPLMPWSLVEYGSAMLAVACFAVLLMRNRRTWEPNGSSLEKGNGASASGPPSG